MIGNRAPSRPGLLLLAALATSAISLPAQSPEDALAMPRRALGVGVVFSSDRWNEYWEGTLRRTNDNIGTLTTQTVTSVVAYGVTDRLGVAAMLPYVTTRASQGTLQGMSGVQDLSLTARFRLLTTPFTERAVISAIVAGTAAIPATQYTPDFQPLAIGSASRRVSGRFALDVQSNSWWFVTGSTGYTWRGNVHLDRSAYYTNGQLYLTNEVEMPDVADYAVSVGYRAGRLCIPISLMRQRTRGGGDIRRQDMPFVSNRMDFSKIGGTVMYSLPIPKRTTIQLGTARTLSGRNVGRSTTVTAGVLYAIQPRAWQ